LVGGAEAVTGTRKRLIHTILTGGEARPSYDGITTPVNNAYTTAGTS
jgi:hypothetical protein